MATGARKVSDQDALDMLRLHRHVPAAERLTQKELAEMYDVHPQTVSRAIKRAERLYAEFERGVESGTIRRSTAVQTTSPPEESGGGPVMLPQQFVEVLSDMNQMQTACRATGTFMATAAHAVYEGLTNEDIPHDQQFKMVVTGTGALAGTLFEMYDGMRQIRRMMQSNARPTMRTIDSDVEVNDE